MLNWDEYNSEDGIPAAVKTNTFVEQAESVAPAQQQKIAEPAPVYADNAAIEKVNAAHAQSATASAQAAGSVHHEPTIADAEIAARAHAAVEKLDAKPGLDELEMGAARLLVDDKRMINCRADL